MVIGLATLRILDHSIALLKKLNANLYFLLLVGSCELLSVLIFAFPFIIKIDLLLLIMSN